MTRDFSLSGASAQRMSCSRQAVLLLLLAVLAISVHALTLQGFQARDGSDIKIHARWAFQFIQALNEGTIYPRWAGYSYFGLGDPTFLYIHPLFYYATAAVNAVTHDVWKSILLIIGLTNMVTAWCVFFLVRRFSTVAVAFLMAAAVSFSPYSFHLSQYQQFLPMYFATPALVLFIGAVTASGPRSRIALTALSLALLTGSHILVAFMALLCTGASMLWRLVSEREAAVRPLLQHAVGVALGLGIVAIYLLPALTLQPLITPDGWHDDDTLDWRNCFLLQYWTLPPSGPRLAHLQWTIALLSLLAWVAAAWLLRRADPASGAKKRRAVELLVMAATALLLGSELAYPLWEHLAVLRKLQFPMRFLLPAAIASALALALAAALAWERHRRVAQAVVGGFIAASVLILAAMEYRLSKDLSPAASLMELNHALLGQVEMKPATAGPAWRDYVQQGGLAAECGRQGLRCTQTLELAHAKAWTIEAPAAGQQPLHLPLFAFPGWSYRVNGQDGTLPIDAANGLPWITPGAGKTTVEAVWTGLPQERWGAGVSLAALGLLALVTVATGRVRGRHGALRHDELALR